MSAKLYKKTERINARNHRVQEMVGRGWGSESRLSMIQMLIPLGLQAVEQELQAEVRALAGGERYDRSGTGIKRWGSNPGSVFVGDQKLKINVPRVRDVEAGEEVQLRSYERLQNPAHLDELALSRVINGISQGKYERAAEHVPETFGIKKTSITRKFIRASGKQLESFLKRDLSGHDIVAIFIDGKFFADNEMVIALGVTISGEKVILGFIETSTENHTICRDFLNGLKSRGLKLDREILFVIDGGKGIYKGIREVMGDNALIARCQWHKRENILDYRRKSGIFIGKNYRAPTSRRAMSWRRKSWDQSGGNSNLSTNRRRIVWTKAWRKPSCCNAWGCSRRSESASRLPTALKT
jgi:putative transposase